MTRAWFGRSTLSRLGVDEETAELVIGHLPQGMAKTYNLYDRLAERRAALEHWLVIRDFGPVAARVVWRRRDRAGLHFNSSQPWALDLLMKAAKDNFWPPRTAR
jgi:hypothetical protein